MDNKTHHLVLVAALASFCQAAGIASAAPFPPSITYQAKLTDAAGNPLSGTYPVRFSLYGTSTGGTALAATTQPVVCTNGLFTAPLASAQKYFDGRALWLGVKAGTDPEMTPRQEIRPVPCRADASPGAIAEGDLLTTSDTPGHAMRANPVTVDGIELYRP